MISRAATLLCAAAACTAWGFTVHLADHGELESGAVLDGVYFTRDGKISEASGSFVSDQMMNWFTREADHCFLLTHKPRSMSAVQREADLRITELAPQLGFDPDFIRALILVESRCRAVTVSPRGAVGLMQILPSTARGMGVNDPSGAGANVEAGMRYLAMLRARFNGSLIAAVSAYNAGPRAVIRHGNLPPYSETRRYASRVFGSYAILRRAHAIANDIKA